LIVDRDQAGALWNAEPAPFLFNVVPPIFWYDCRTPASPLDPTYSGVVNLVNVLTPFKKKFYMPKTPTLQQIRRKRIKELKHILARLDYAVNDPATPQIRLASLTKSYAMNLTQLHRLEKQQQQEAERNGREPRKPRRPRKLNDHQDDPGQEQRDHIENQSVGQQSESPKARDKSSQTKGCLGCEDPECNYCKQMKALAKRRRLEFDSAKPSTAFDGTATQPPQDIQQVDRVRQNQPAVSSASDGRSITDFRVIIAREPRFCRARVGTMYLTAADAADILKGNRPASMRELEYVLQNAELLKLSASGKEQLRAFLRRTCANHVHGLPVGNDNGLNLVETPFGPLLNPDWIEQWRRAALRQIESCPAHQPPRCRCWIEVRERLWDLRKQFGDGSPENWCAQRVWSDLEHIEKWSQRKGNANAYSDSDLDSLAGLNWIGKRKPKG
jgi:hypothetical protein